MDTKPIAKLKKSKACIPCRESKRKCDGNRPCSRCKRGLGKVCTYRDDGATNQALKKVQSDLFNVVTRRKYVQSFLEGINPSVLFHGRAISVDSFDQPTSKPKLLQINAILASSTRAFGAPPNIYQAFERKACKYAGELMSSFTYDTALGFNFLAYYFWGKDEINTMHYRSVALSLCKCALQKQENSIDKTKLAQLHLASMSIQKVDETNPQRAIEQIVPPDAWNNDIDYRLLSMPEINGFTVIHAELEKMFYFTDDAPDTFNTMPIDEFNKNCKLLEAVCKSLIDKAAGSALILLVTAIRGFFMAFLYNAAGFARETLTKIETSVSLLTANDYLIGMGGAQFIIVFHTAFRVAFDRQDYELANRINVLQKKQAKIFDVASTFVQMDESKLSTSAFCSISPDGLTSSDSQLNYSCNLSPPEPSPFHWMSNVPIPVISSRQDNFQRLSPDLTPPLAPSNNPITTNNPLHYKACK